MKRVLLTLMSLAALCTLSGCSGKSGGESSPIAPDDTSSAEVTTAADAKPDSDVTTAPDKQSDPVDEKPQVTTAQEQEITPQVAEYVTFSISVEAQEGEYGGEIEERDSKAGASEGTYLANFREAPRDNWSYTAELPASQYYNVVIVVYSSRNDTPKENALLINGEEYSRFTTDGSGEFEAIGFDNIWLEKGENSFGIGVIDGAIAFDYMMISASDAVAALDLSYDKMPQLSNKNASTGTMAVYEYLAGIYGRHILSGQYETVSTNAETNAIYELTGHYPAIRFGDFMDYTNNDSYADDIDKAIEWDENGGLVGYIWHWEDPMGSGGYYSSEIESAPAELVTDFDIASAVTELDIAQIPYDDLAVMCLEGGISAECLAVVSDIDIISYQLLKLQEKGITVLWRPLHEAGGGWFWWGRDAESYKWLWRLMYDRMTNYHGLNNLIWIWNGQHPDWYVGDEYCDIISADIYDQKGASQLSAFLSLHRISTGKMLALSECGNAPDIQMFANEKTMWSFFGIWGGGYVIDEYGAYSDEFTSQQQMIDLYSNNIVICRDELPDFEALTKELELRLSKAEEEKPDKDKDDKSDKDKEENADSEEES